MNGITHTLFLQYIKLKTRSYEIAFLELRFVCINLPIKILIYKFTHGFTIFNQTITRYPKHLK